MKLLHLLILTLLAYQAYAITCRCYCCDYPNCTQREVHRGEVSNCNVCDSVYCRRYSDKCYLGSSTVCGSLFAGWVIAVIVIIAIFFVISIVIVILRVCCGMFLFCCAAREVNHITTSQPNQPLIITHQQYQNPPVYQQHQVHYQQGYQ